MKIKTIAAVSCICACTSFANAAGTDIVSEISDCVFPANTAQAPKSFTYMPDGNSYAMLSEDGRSIETYDIRSGKHTGTLMSADNTREVTLPSFEGFILSPDASRIIVYTDRKPIYRRSSTARYYVYELRTRMLVPLSHEFTHTQIPVFSPDSRMVAFVANNNIYIKKLDYNSEVAVTKDGSTGKIINGATDWTYEEEFSTTSTLAWAPDNTALSYVRFDESQVPVYSLEMYQGSCNQQNKYALYPGQMSYKYPVAGEHNSRVTLHSYDIDDRRVKDIALPDRRIEYIPRICYGPTAKELMVVTLNRDQNRMEIYSVNPPASTSRSVYVQESAKGWILPQSYEDMHFGKSGFVVAAPDSKGHVQLKKYAYTGAHLANITSDDCDVTAYYGEDASGRHYWQAASPTPMERTVMRSTPKGAIAVSAKSGTNSAQFSPAMNYCVINHSDTKTPPVYTLSGADGSKIRVLEDNAALKQHASKWTVDKEFITIPSDGCQLNAYIFKPHNFDPSKKYPVVMYQYSGPGSQEVLDRWQFDWMNYFAHKGFIIMCADGRGTGGRGTDFMYKVYRNLGYYETIDQIAAARYAASLPYVDAAHIGIFGWSYGGYETLMAVSAEGNPYRAAVAVAPVTDWRYYDTVYAERFMLTPRQNDDGYNNSAPIKRASDMSARLLLMYGTADDNVHPANSIEYVSALQSNGILCDMLVFPNMNHSIYGCNSRALVYGRMFDFFNRELR